MNKLGKKRLLKLAKFLRTVVPEESFNFGQWMLIGKKKPLDAIKAGGGCGTVGCAIGWTPACFPSLARWVKDGRSMDGRPMMNVWRKGKPVKGGNIDFAMEFFDLKYGEAVHLFAPNRSLTGWDGMHMMVIRLVGLDGASSKEEVADHIESFVAWKEGEGK